MMGVEWAGKVPGRASRAWQEMCLFMRHGASSADTVREGEVQMPARHAIPIAKRVRWSCGSYPTSAQHPRTSDRPSPSVPYGAEGRVFSIRAEKRSQILVGAAQRPTGTIGN